MASIEDLIGKRKKVSSPDDRSPQQKFEEKMEEIRLKNLETLTKRSAVSTGAEYIDLKGFPISPEALQLVPREQSREHKVVAFLYTGKEVRLGAVNPKDPAIQEVVFQVQERAHPDHAQVYMISETSFMHAEKLYDALPEIKAVVKGVKITEAELNAFRGQAKSLKTLSEKVQKVSVTDFMALIIAAALESDVSDIHVEAQEKQVDLRFRIDGVLQNVGGVDSKLWPRIVNRIKLFSGLKINVSSVPQDGRFTIFLSKEKVDVRVSTLPTSYGESVVMRLLKSSTAALQFDQLGIRGKAYEQLKREIARPNGMIITTGPTGSGKTTTLYAILNQLNDGRTKIITLEDPVEYKLAGISQSQIDKSKEYTFAKGLASILRQDPDVVMVGELRDLETAEVAIQAALTGHIMVSTIHTNSASGAIPRFLSMGVKPFLLAPALNAIIGQRLVRKICEKCKAKTDVSAELLGRVKETLTGLSKNADAKIDLQALTFYKGGGCDACGGIGYKGRIGIYEIMVMSPGIEKIILSGQVSEYDMQKLAIEQGMVTMAQDGLLKALDGVTTIEEVFEVAE